MSMVLVGTGPVGMLVVMGLSHVDRQDAQDTQDTDRKGRCWG